VGVCPFILWLARRFDCWARLVSHLCNSFLNW